MRMKTTTFLFCMALLTARALHAQGAYTMADTVLAKRYMEEATKLSKAGKYDAALERVGHAEAIFQQVLGDTNIYYANVLQLKGVCFDYKGNYEKAEEYYQKALNIDLKLFGRQHKSVAQLLNNLGIIYMSKGELAQALIVHQEALEVRLKILGENHVEIAQSFGNLGLVYWTKGDYDLAGLFLQKALDVVIKKLGPTDPYVALTYNNLGAVYSRKGDYKRAKMFYEKSLKIRLETIGPEHPDIAASYNNMGEVLYLAGNISLAEEYFEKALLIRLKTLESGHVDIAQSYINLGVVKELHNELGASINYNTKALEIFLKTYNGEHAQTATVFDNLGVVYKKKGANKKSEEYYQKALDIKIKTLGNDHPLVSSTLNNLGSICIQIKDYDKAIRHFENALKIKIKTLGRRHPDIAFYNTNLGIAHYHRGDFLKSDSLIQIALKILDFSDIHSIDRVTSIPQLIASLQSKGNLYQNWFDATGQSAFLYKSRESGKILDSVVQYQRTRLATDSKKSLSREAHLGYETTIGVSCLLQQITDSLHFGYEAFGYAEKSHALLLYEALKGADALNYAGIPDSLLQREYDLRIDITYHEKRRQDLYTQGKEETDTTVLAVSGKIFDLRREYEALLDTFKTRYPDYYRAKYDLQTIDVPTLQNTLLQPDQALLEYFVGDSSVFIFLVKKDDYRVIEIKKDFPLEAWVNQLRHGIYGYYQHPEKPDTLFTSTPGEYADAAWHLYQKLLAPVDSLLPRRVTIIPDGVLGYVPFEALLKEKPDIPHRFHDHAYFGLDHTLSYCYSATLWREMMQKKHKKRPNKMLLAMAPFEKKSYRQVEDLFGKVVANPENDSTDFIAGGNRHDLDSLSHTGEEVLALARIWNDDYLLDRDATKTRFTDQAGDYRILHLATHGKADSRSGDYSFLAFAQIPDSVENEILYVREIYNLALNADLVTLSACETGVGELQRGEGIISLARAFSYAGAKSIVTSLWQVSDASTKDLMIEFNRYLKKGLPKDEALAKAQRRYLKAHRGPSASPYFWAGFVAIGDMGAIAR